MYEYRARVTDVYDGDTITCEVDLGFRFAAKKMKFRLYGINTPEVRGPERPEGLKVRDWLRERILGKDVIIKTYKDGTGKYGRWLCDVFPVPDDAPSPTMYSYNEAMVDLGLAKRATY